MEKEDLQSSLSIRLSNVLDALGASEHIRWIYWDYAKQREIANSARRKFLSQEFHYFVFGSFCEGSTLIGLNSDRDFLMCNGLFPVFEYVIEGPDEGFFLVILHDDTTSPGYVKLQSCKDGHPRNILSGNVQFLVQNEDIDSDGNVCFKHFSYVKAVPSFEERNGPADTSPGVRNFTDPIDYVYAVRCRKLPSFADSWVLRKRSQGWPSQEQISKMRDFGCFFVGKGHPQSPQRTLEWSISFSLQERELMSSLNPVQHKCYILLKTIKNDLIRPTLEKNHADGNSVKGISSYHCKTCLFYTIETAGQIVWTPENLVRGTILCLKFLLDCLKNDFCPSYFLPEKNLFESLDSQSKDIALSVLNDILSSGIEFLFTLKACDIGKLILITEQPLDIGQVQKINQYEENFSRHWFMIKDTAGLMHHYIKDLSVEGTYAGSIFRLLKLIRFLRSPGEVTVHSSVDAQKALESFLPHAHPQMAQLVAVEMLSTHCHGKWLTHLEKVFKKHILQSMTYDVFTARLLLATYYFHVGNITICKKLLLKCEGHLTDQVVSLCGCYDNSEFVVDRHKRIPDTVNITYREFRKTLTTGCMVFLPKQADLVHPALQFEIFRAVYIDKQYLNPFSDFWFGWACIDSQVYLYLLKYLVFSQTEDNLNQHVALDRIQFLLEKDSNLGHEETAYNLLGWIYTRERRIDGAAACFYKSWKIQPYTNAAKWHIVLLLHGLFKEDQMREKKRIDKVRE